MTSCGAELSGARAGEGPSVLAAWLPLMSDAVASAAFFAACLGRALLAAFLAGFLATFLAAGLASPSPAAASADRVSSPALAATGLALRPRAGFLAVGVT